jgi:phosphonate transport system substrate-binding protein
MVLSKTKLLVSVLLILKTLFLSGISFAGEPLVFSVHPYLPSAELFKRFLPLMDYLNTETGQTITLNISSTYEEHIEAIGSGQSNIAYMGPASYVEMVNRYGRKPLLARLEVNGSPTFRGVIIVRKEDKSATLKDLVGKRFAFGDPASTMSSLVPMYMFIKEGIELEKLSGYVHLRNHNNVALSVLVGDSDAGAVKEEVFYKYERRGLKALAFTPRISEHVLVGHNTLPAETIDSLRKALYNLKDTKPGRDIMMGIKSSISAFVTVQDEDYDNLRIIMQTVMKNNVQK